MYCNIIREDEPQNRGGFSSPSPPLLVYTLEFTTVLTQIEACLNSRLLIPLPSAEDGIEALIPGHFLIGRPLESIPDPSFSYRSVSLLHQWHLCQSLVQIFGRGGQQSISLLSGDSLSGTTLLGTLVWETCIVVLHEDGLVARPLARVMSVHPGKMVW